MSKVIVEKNKPKFDPIELNINITISSMEDYLTFLSDVEYMVQKVEFDSVIANEFIEELKNKLTEE